MRLDDRARLGIDFARDMLLVELLAELDEALLVDPAHEFRGARHQSRKTDRAEAVLRDDLRGFGNLLDRHFAALEFLAQHRGRGVARDDRAIEIEQRGDMRSGFGRQDFFQMRLRPRHAHLPTKRLYCRLSLHDGSKDGVYQCAQFEIRVRVRAPPPRAPVPRSARGPAGPTGRPSCPRRRARDPARATRARSRR